MLRESVACVVDIADLVDRLWGMHAAGVSPLGGGINSETLLVKPGGSSYVAKRVSPTAVADLVAGCEVAAWLAEAGFVTGPPVPMADGRLVSIDDALALLEYVPGRELEGDSDDEQRWIAHTLAGVHRAGSPTDGRGTATFMADWLSPELPGVEAHSWLEPVVAAVRAETDPLEATWSVLHTDPAPEAFRHDDSTGVTGLVDWTGARRGPVLYDVASALTCLREAANTRPRSSPRTRRTDPSGRTRCGTSMRSEGSGTRSRARTLPDGWPPTTSPAESVAPRTRRVSTMLAAALQPRSRYHLRSLSVRCRLSSHAVVVPGRPEWHR
jgi:Phosphotransferase enzyme family